MKNFASFLLILIISMSLFLTACEETPVIANIPEDEQILDESPKYVYLNNKPVALTLWSWQVTTPEIAQQYVDLLKKNNFNTVDFCVVWDKIESERDVFNFAYFDAIMDVFVKNELEISLSLLFWSSKLSWKDELDLQYTDNEILYVFDDFRGSFLSMNSQNNKKIIENTLLTFAQHANERYKNNILRWHIRTNCFGDLEYSPVTHLDYSESEFNAFFDFLLKTYTNIETFNSKNHQSYASWDELRIVEKTELTRIYAFDWKIFKQESVINMANLSRDIFKAVNPNIPIAMQVGCFWDSSAAFYRGIFDQYTVSKKSNVDILHIDDALGWDHYFSTDIATSLTEIDLAMQVNGAWSPNEKHDDYLKQAEIAGMSDFAYLNTSNWNIEDLQKYGDDYLSKMNVMFNNAKMRDLADQTDVLMINTLNFILCEPPIDLYVVLQRAYNNVSGSDKKRVRFITDTMIMDNPEILDGIKKIHIGKLDDIIFMYNDVAEILSQNNVKIICDSIMVPNFLNEYKMPIDDDIQEILRKRLS